MKICVAVLLCYSLVLAGCETPASSSGAYTVQQIKSTGSGAGKEAPVRIKLSSGGNVSEAELSSIVVYVKIVAKREATKRQAKVAQQRARAIAARMTPATRRRRAISRSKPSGAPRTSRRHRGFMSRAPSRPPDPRQNSSAAS